ncbi:MAG: hypothetical protein J7M30_09840 [Deltaproteobacteria bacterium]|nr:hypothetical protein [Deltaproteobacteria bacterium]
MKRILSLFAITLFIVPVAFAEGFSEIGLSDIGVGWDNGYSVKISAEPVSIQLTGKFDSVIPEDDDIDTETDAEIAAYVAYPVLNFDESNFNVFGGLGLMPSTHEITVGGTTYDKELDYAIRFGIEPEVKVTDNIGLSAKVGLQVKLDQGYDDLDDSGETDVGAWGSIGVHWFFK